MWTPFKKASWQKIQDTEEEKAVKNTAQDPQVHKLLPIFPENSNFQSMQMIAVSQL